MENKGLLALTQLILPSEILSNIEVVKVDEQSDLIRIHLDEIIKDSYKSNSTIESKVSVILSSFEILPFVQRSGLNSSLSQMA